MSGATDLSGEWIGFYNYDFPCPPIQFEASIRESGGLITGVTTETFDGPGGHGTLLQGVIDGRREGSILRFTKIYDDLALAPNVIHYEGLIQADGDEVEGDWTIPGQGAGTFMMMRKRGKDAAEARRVEEEVPAGR